MKSLCLWLVLLCGCANYDPASNPVHSVGMTAGGNAQTQDWSAGITITFKTPPPEFVVADIMVAGGHKLSDLAFALPQTRALDAATQRAIASAMTVPGTVVTHAP